MPADDVASAVAKIALSAPANGTVEIAGPGLFRLDELVRRRLAQLNDPREVITDSQAHYSGALLGERTLVPGKDARLAETSFETWLTQPAAKTAAVAQQWACKKEPVCLDPPQEHNENTEMKGSLMLGSRPCPNLE
jgi:uncharacterized protein YbjT (DUF2867 family)